MKCVCVLILFFSTTVFCKENVLSSFQNQIKDCEIKLIELQNVKNFLNLHNEIQKKYLLLSEKTLYRELYFQIKNENRKIKITNDVLELFKIGDQERHSVINTDPRQKAKTLQAQISQLVLNAKIEKDWQKTLEIRENGLRIEAVRVDSKMTQLKISSDKNAKALDCQVVNSSEICLCNKTPN